MSNPSDVCLLILSHISLPLMLLVFLSFALVNLFALVLVLFLFHVYVVI
jgi:hypothetical protein